jgi:hypothetical protein
MSKAMEKSQSRFPEVLPSLITQTEEFGKESTWHMLFHEFLELEACMKESTEASCTKSNTACMNFA